MHCFLIKKNKITWIYISRCIKTGFPICPNFENLNNFFFENGNRVVSQKTFTTFFSVYYIIFFDRVRIWERYLCVHHHALKTRCKAIRIFFTRCNPAMSKSVKKYLYFQWTYKNYNAVLNSHVTLDFVIVYTIWFVSRQSTFWWSTFPRAYLGITGLSQRHTGPDLTNEGFVFLQLRVRTVHAVCYLFTHINVFLSFSLKKSVEETTAFPRCHGIPHNACFS